MKAIGFSNGFVARLIFAESIAIALAGGVLGIALTFPIAEAFGIAMGTLFPVLFVSDETLAAAGRRRSHRRCRRRGHSRVARGRVRIVDGLRSVA